jgi:hypothetical protein
LAAIKSSKLFLCDQPTFAHRQKDFAPTLHYAVRPA